MHLFSFLTTKQTNDRILLNKTGESKNFLQRQSVTLTCCKVFGDFIVLTQQV